MCVYTVDHIVDNVVVAPSPSASLQTHFANVKAVVGGLPAFAQLAFVRVRLSPPHKVGSCIYAIPYSYVPNL